MWLHDKQSLLNLHRGHQVGLEWPKNKPSQADLAWLVLHVRDYWLGLACKFKKRALAWFWLGLWPGYSVLLYHMTFHPWDQNKTCSKSLKLIVLWNLITVYYFFLSFGYWLGLTCNIILVFQLGLAWLGLFLEIKRLGLAWFGFFWCGFGLAWLGLEYFYHKKTWLGLACSEKSRLADPYTPMSEEILIWQHDKSISQNHVRPHCWQSVPTVPVCQVNLVAVLYSMI